MLAAVGARLEAVDFYTIKTDRSWIRDFGPIFVKSASEVAMTSWEFNGWAKYDNYKNDNRVVEQVCGALKLRCFEAEIVLEGGSIDVNGAGVCSRPRSVCSPMSRRENPGLSRAQLLNLHCVIFWEPSGLFGSATALRATIRTAISTTWPGLLMKTRSLRFWRRIRPTRITVRPRTTSARLRALGEFRVVTLPMPEPVYFEGQRLPASYANFYIANGMVLVPTFNDPQDRKALNILSEMFPTRQIVGIASSDLVLGLGTLHCMTQQQPRA